MKTLVKTAIVGAFALAMTTFGTSKANAAVFVYVGAPYPAYVAPAPVYYGPRVVVGAPYPYCYGGWGWYGWHRGWYHGGYRHWR